MTSDVERRLRALVVDDEPVARAALRSLVEEVPWLEYAGEAADGVEALAAIRAARPDLIFLDVQMPGLDGIEVAREAGGDASIIFTTAFDDHAMVAFELGAIDYLLKPFGRDRFQRAIDRARPHLEARRRAGNDQPPIAERLSGERLADERGRLTRIFVRDRGHVVPLQVSEIVRCEADDDYVAIHAGGRRYLVYITLADFAARLDPERFVRIHRSHVVNLDAILSMSSYDANRLEVRMKDGSRVVASRAGTQALRARIG